MKIDSEGNCKKPGTETGRKMTEMGGRRIHLTSGEAEGITSWNEFSITSGLFYVCLVDILKARQCRQILMLRDLLAAKLILPCLRSFCLANFILGGEKRCEDKMLIPMHNSALRTMMLDMENISSRFPKNGSATTQLYGCRKVCS